MALSRPSAERWLDPQLTKAAREIEVTAKVFREPGGRWTLESSHGRSEIGDSYESARDSLKLIIAATRRDVELR